MRPKINRKLTNSMDEEQNIKHQSKPINVHHDSDLSKKKYSTAIENDSVSSIDMSKIDLLEMKRKYIMKK